MMAFDDVVYAPFTKEQVEALQKWQSDKTKHPFTCECGNKLSPHVNGWFCPVCFMVQSWCYEFMLKERNDET